MDITTILNFSMDGIITSFVANNMLSIGIFMVVLKAIAENTSWNWDNKLADILSAAFDAITKRGNK